MKLDKKKQLPKLRQYALDLKQAGWSAEQIVEALDIGRKLMERTLDRRKGRDRGYNGTERD